MVLVFSAILGTIPLLAFAWMVTQGSVATVDGLFTRLILLALSGILFLNAFLELKAKKKSKTPQAQK